MSVNILIFTWTKWDESWHIWRGLIIGCMFCLQVERPIVGVGGWVCVCRGGGAVADPDLQIRGGEFIQSMRKQGGNFQKKFFGPSLV